MTNSRHVSLPNHIYCYVGNKYLGPKMPDGKTECILHGLYSRPGQKMLTHIILETGAHWTGIPLFALQTKPEIDLLYDSNILEPWGGMGEEITTSYLKLLDGMKVELIKHKQLGRHTGTVIDWNDGFSRYPQEHKPLSLIELDNGQIALLPNNYFRVEDKHFTHKEKEQELKYYKRGEIVYYE
jgi:hypothetical protein